jgi:hypothetical protein
MPASLASANNGSGSTDGRRKIIMARAARRIFGDGPCRDRTCDLGIKSPLLYQLS